MNTFAEYLIALALVILLGLLSNPFMLWMPTPTQMVVVLVAAILAVVYGGFVLKEQTGDERETLHRMLAGRAAFLTAMATLTLALIYQGLTHAIDPWIPLALALTILAKLAARAWANHYR
ncbi:MAG: hypothetical protein KGI73_01505 [Patescibacteria group bacterium]|nr:hypothetical protein [Patescibacteria group bacterium]